MLIDINSDDEIVIDELPPQVKSYQKSQLGFIGFKRRAADGKLVSHATNRAEFILKLLEYFKTEKILYSLSENCKRLIQEVTKEIEQLELLRRVGEQFKTGEYSGADVKQFQEEIGGLVSRKLKSHQLIAAQHLYLMKNSANFSVPGSGKTSVVLSVYEKLRRENRVNRLFVVGPPACFGPWRAEFYSTLGRVPEYRVLAGIDCAARQKEYYATQETMAELYLITYHTLLNDQEGIKNLFQNVAANVFLVVDEAHYMKRLGGNWATALLWLAKHAKFRCVLTGTPMPKSYSDVFNIFEFLWPERPILDETSKIQIDRFESLNQLEEAKRILKNRVGPFFYRVKKQDLGLMPPVFHSPILISMNQHERTLYDAIDEQIRTYAREDYLKNIDVVRRLRRGRIMRLRQCVSYAGLLQKAIEGYDEQIISNSRLADVISNYHELERPAKLTTLMQMLERLHKSGEKVVIWANFVMTLEYLKKQITQHGFKCDLIYGKTPIETSTYEEERTREKIRDEFIDPKSGLDILLANPAACAESISLHKACHHAIYYDLSYNCAQYLQSLDRIHRVGGSETVEAHYYFLQYQDTLESDIKANLDRKAQNMYALIDEELPIYSLDMFEDDADEAAFERLFGA